MTLARATVLLLALVAIAVLVHVYEFGQHRFFTVDEWQYGHATWLVSRGERPYVDFYEHHFPASYAVSAPLFADDPGFRAGALRMRQIAFAWLALAAAALFAGARAATGSTAVGLLSVIVPFTTGFSLMCAVEYRADNFAGFAFVACLGLLEWNRRRASRAAAAACGVLLAAATLATQKMLPLAGGTAAAYLALDALRARRGGGGAEPPLVARPGAFLCAAGAVLAAALLAAAALGMLSKGWEIAVVGALRHERDYPAVVSLWRFVEPFWRATAPTTAPIALFAAGFLAVSRSRFWLVPVALAAVSGAALSARYPYNYVTLCVLLAACAVRGLALAAWRLPERLRPWRPLFWLLPLALVANQVGFVARASSNEEQLRLLETIERWSTPDDVVIDGAGGALFRPHASYYWYHGGAHRRMFADYFAGPLLDDYRESRARFWIRDFRLRHLPEPVRRWFREHYVRAWGSLFVLGFETPATAEEREVEIDVIRAGDWYVTPRGPGAETPPRIDGRPVRDGRVHLDEGRHAVRLAPGSPAFAITAVPPGVFAGDPGRGSVHSPLFEFGEPAGAP